MANVLEKLIETFDGGYEGLNAAERETYTSHLKVMEGKAVSMDDLKKFVREMITAIEKSLVDTKEGSHESRNLKGRLKNFLMLEQYMFVPERAKAALERFYGARK